MIIKISTKISTNLAFVGFLLGLYSGFITRDEFYYNSQQRIEEIGNDFYQKDRIIQKDLTKLFNI